MPTTTKFSTARIRELLEKKFPGAVPVIVSPLRKSDPPISQSAFMVRNPAGISFGHFVTNYIRPRIDKLGAEDGLHYFIQEKEDKDPTVMPGHSQLLTTLYKEYASDNLTLVVRYTKESTFGA
jgi:hypothetical protein